MARSINKETETIITCDNQRSTFAQPFDNVACFFFCENQFETRNTDLSLQYGPASENQYRCVVVHDVFQFDPTYDLNSNVSNGNTILLMGFI